MPPLNRIIAFAGPYISLAAGGAATWIIAKANALGIDGLDHDDTAQQIASGISFTLAAGLTWLGQSKWLTGHHLQIAGDAQVQAAALATPTPPPPGKIVPSGMAGTMNWAAPELEELPSDEEEFAAPPPGDPPVQPSQSGLIEP
jgi:hypothetical protein